MREATFDTYDCLESLQGGTCVKAVKGGEGVCLHRKRVEVSELCGCEGVKGVMK